MTYATVQDFRDEGVTEPQVSDERLAELIDEACATVDKVTRWFFNPRSLVLRLDSHGAATIDLPYPLITINSITDRDAAVDLDEDHLFFNGAPVRPGFQAPYIERLRGGRWSRSRKRVVIDAVWGYTVDDIGGSPDPQGRTPPDIKRATMMLVMRSLPLMSDDDEVDWARSKWRLMEQETRDQKIKMKPRDVGVLTGDADIDDILAQYCAPAGIGATG